jgi:hypothetical protein
MRVLSITTVAAAIEWGGELVLVRTGHPSHTHHQKRNDIVRAETGETLAEWQGAGIEAATACGDSIVCACLDGIVYIVQGGEVVQVDLPQDDIWPTRGIEFSPGIALFVGLKGKLLLVDVAARTARISSLASMDVAKPGRNIDGVIKTGPGTCYLLGKREMLIHYDAERCEVLSTTRSEICFKSAVNFQNTLWITAIDGGINHKLARIADSTVEYHDSPVGPGPYSPSLAVCERGLLTGCRRVFLGIPGEWREIGAVDDESIISLFPRGEHVLAVTSEGKVKRFGI